MFDTTTYCQPCSLAVAVLSDEVVWFNITGCWAFLQYTVIPSLTQGSGCAKPKVQSQDLWHAKPSDNITVFPDLEISLLYTLSSSLIIPSYYYKGVMTHTIPFYWNWIASHNLLRCHVDMLWIPLTWVKVPVERVKNLKICFGSFVLNFIEHQDQLVSCHDLDSAWDKIYVKGWLQFTLRKDTQWNVDYSLTLLMFFSIYNTLRTSENQWFLIQCFFKIWK